MAIVKSTTASSSYIVTTNSTTTQPTFIHEPVVFDGRLVDNSRVTTPGIFTDGTAREGTASNPNNDANY